MEYPIAESDAFAASRNLIVTPTPLFPQEGPAVIAFRSDVATEAPEARDFAFELREVFHDFMRSRGWRTVERTLVQDFEHDWRIDVLVTDDHVNVVITHNGLPWLYQGTLYDPVPEDGVTWVSRAATEHYVELVYFLDPGGQFTPDDVEEYEELLKRQRAIIIAVPITWHIG